MSLRSRNTVNSFHLFSFATYYSEYIHSSGSVLFALAVAAVDELQPLRAGSSLARDDLLAMAEGFKALLLSPPRKSGG